MGETAEFYKRYTGSNNILPLFSLKKTVFLKLLHAAYIEQDINF